MLLAFSQIDSINKSSTTMKNNRKIFLITTLLSCITFLSINADTIERGDTIRTNDTWSADTLLVTDNIVIMDDVTVNIAPGTNIVFEGHYHIVVLGTVLALGTDEDSITFTFIDTTGLGIRDIPDGGWEGIIFNNSAVAGGADGAMNNNDTSRFDRCIFEYSKSCHHTNMVWSTIEVQEFSKLVISNCDFRNNYTFYRGGAIYLFASNAKILKNYIHHNTAKDYGGGIYSHNSSPLIEGNNILYS